jgi:carboxypeptidase family protein
MAESFRKHAFLSQTQWARLPVSRLLFAMATPLTIALSQQSESPKQVSCQRSTRDSLNGVVRGAILDDSTGKPVPHRGVFLVSTACTAVTDDFGRFEFVGVPPGVYTFGVAPLGYRRFHPVIVTVGRADTAHVEARLRPENRVADCLEVQECARLLNYAQKDVELDDVESLREAALRTSVAIVVEEGWRLGEFVVCVDEPSPRIRKALATAIPNVVAKSECALAPQTSANRDPALARTSTNERAVGFSARISKQSDSRATAVLSNYVGPLWAEGWTCEFKRENLAWIATSCRMDWIS